MNYTLVCGVDLAHLKQLAWTWPTWVKHKPGILDNPMIVFYDKEQITKEDVREVQSGYECGVGLENFQDIKPGDVFEVYKIEEVEAEM